MFENNRNLQMFPGGAPGLRLWGIAPQQAGLCSPAGGGVLRRHPCGTQAGTFYSKVLKMYFYSKVGKMALKQVGKWHSNRCELTYS